MDSTFEGDTVSSLPLVLHQCNDLLNLQEILLTQSLTQQREASYRRTSESQTNQEEYESLYRQLQKERLSHAEAKASLTDERENVELMETEINVLKKQLHREKSAFEQAFGLLKTRALADSSKAETLLAKTTALETLCAKKDEELASQKSEIKQLHKKTEQLKIAHKLEVQELNIRLQQERYMTNNLGSGQSARENKTVTKTTTRTKRRQKQ